MKKMRFLYAGIFLLLLFVEIGIGTFLQSGIIRAYGGDVLVLPVIYFLVRIFWVKPSLGNDVILPLALFGVGAAAEVVQAFDLTGKLGIAKDSVLGILIGSVSDPADLLCYGLGILLIYSYLLMEHVFRKMQNT